MDKMEERVLVVPASQIELVTSRDPAAAQEIIDLAEDLCWFYPRKWAETDESLKQVIPYILIRHGDNYLLTERIQQTESRLDGKKSLGIGGHVNDGDRDLEKGFILVHWGMERELKEEIEMWSGPRVVRGVIYDDSTEVSRVHVGIVYEVQAAGSDFTLLEPDKTRGQWVSKYNLGEHRPAMESWSQIALDQFILI